MQKVRDAHKQATEWHQQFRGIIKHALESRIGRRADTDDLAQEVYLRLLRVTQPELINNPQAYLYRVALNVAEEWRQRAAQRLDHSDEFLKVMTADEDVEHTTRNEERDVLIRNALTALPLSSRTAVILHVRDGMTYEQVANHMGTSRRAVKRYISTGYSKLRDQLDILKESDPRGATNDRGRS